MSVAYVMPLCRTVRRVLEISVVKAAVLVIISQVRAAAPSVIL
jgi:hypothetical protein